MHEARQNSWLNGHGSRPLCAESVGDYDPAVLPFGFPSHQGLLAPLWRVWPGRFSVIALWIGAIVPDVVDGATSIALRGRPGQWMGHSIIGLFALCVPVGLGLTTLTRRIVIRLSSPGERQGDRGMRLASRIASWALAIDVSKGLIFDARSVWMGALSHVVFDLASHEHSMLLWPWAKDPAWFGSWWHATWFRISLPGYAGYSIGPHFVGWLVLSVVGAVLFFKYPPHRTQTAGREAFMFQRRLHDGDATARSDG